jgi:uncharacterized protein (TIGR00255 family)
MLQSMTAFASHSSYHHVGELVWEIKSTNHRYLEFYFKLPDEFRCLEYELREIAKKEFTRGKLDCFLSLASDKNSPANLKINQSLLQQLVATHQELSKTFQQPLQLDFLKLLAYPGIIDNNFIDKQQLLEFVRTNFMQAIQALKQARLKEGLQIANIIRDKVAAMHSQLAIIQLDYPLAIENYMADLRAKLAAIITQKNSDLEVRIEQELVFYLQKTQINEELDRLAIHLHEVLDSCAMNVAVGRRLDFLMQELNREANTLAAKSISKVISRAAIELKVLIEQMREQVQNLE